MSATLSIPPLPLLRGEENLGDWKGLVMQVFRAYEMLDCLLNPSVISPSQQALGVILLTPSVAPVRNQLIAVGYDFYKVDQHPKELYDLVLRVFEEPKVDDEKIILLRKLGRLDANDYPDLDMFVDHIYNLKYQLQKLDGNVTDESIICFGIAALKDFHPKLYRLLVQELNNETLTWYRFQGALLLRQHLILAATTLAELVVEPVYRSDSCSGEDDVPAFRWPDHLVGKATKPPVFGGHISKPHPMVHDPAPGFCSPAAGQASESKASLLWADIAKRFHEAQMKRHHENIAKRDNTEFTQLWENDHLFPPPESEHSDYMFLHRLFPAPESEHPADTGQNSPTSENSEGLFLHRFPMAQRLVSSDQPPADVIPSTLVTPVITPPAVIKSETVPTNPVAGSLTSAALVELQRRLAALELTSATSPFASDLESSYKPADPSPSPGSTFRLASNYDPSHFLGGNGFASDYPPTYRPKSVSSYTPSSPFKPSGPRPLDFVPGLSPSYRPTSPDYTGSTPLPTKSRLSSRSSDVTTTTAEAPIKPEDVTNNQLPSSNSGPKDIATITTAKLLQKANYTPSEIVDGVACVCGFTKASGMVMKSLDFAEFEHWVAKLTRECGCGVRFEEFGETKTLARSRYGLDDKVLGEFEVSDDCSSIAGEDEKGGVSKSEAKEGEDGMKTDSEEKSEEGADEDGEFASSEDEGKLTPKSDEVSEGYTENEEGKKDDDGPIVS